MKRWTAAAAVVAVLAACGGDDGETTAEPGGSGQAEEMLANLPSCDRVPLDEEPEIDAAVPGLVLPDDARLTSVLEQGSLTTVDGTIRMTPLDLRADYESRTDLDVIRIEDEIFEAEVLVRAEGRRMYLRATALCADGTALTAVIGPDEDDAELPEFQSDL